MVTLWGATVAVDFIGKTAVGQMLGAVTFAAIAGFYTSPAIASRDIPDVLFSSLVDEVRLGVQSSDIFREESGVNINVEVLFRRPNNFYDSKVLLFLLNPRLHIGGSLNTAGDTSQAYAGATWDYRLTNRLFVEASFGGVIHDGNLNRLPSTASPALGCRVMFRESASVGIELTENLRLMGTIDHISNAGLCNFNDGLTTVGARIGYKF